MLLQLIALALIFVNAVQTSKSQFPHDRTFRSMRKVDGQILDAQEKMFASGRTDVRCIVIA